MPPSWFVAFAFCGMACAQNESMRVVLVTEFAHPASAAVVRAIQREVSDILAPAGIVPEWFDEKQPPGGVPAAAIRLRFSGQCRGVFPTLSGTDGHHRLGEAGVLEGHVQPIAHVDCDAVTRLLPAWTLPYSRVVGIAVARILCHELFHILTDTMEHETAGLFRETLTSRELGPLPVRFTGGQLERLRKSIVQERRVSEADPLRSARLP